MLCKDCAYWLKDFEFKRMGSCKNEKVSNKIVFGNADYFLISEDFGCKFFKKKINIRINYEKAKNNIPT